MAFAISFLQAPCVGWSDFIQQDNTSAREGLHAPGALPISQPKAHSSSSTHCSLHDRPHSALNLVTHSRPSLPGKEAGKTRSSVLGSSPAQEWQVTAELCGTGSEEDKNRSWNWKGGKCTHNLTDLEKEKMCAHTRRDRGWPQVEYWLGLSSYPKQHHWPFYWKNHIKIHSS